MKTCIVTEIPHQYPIKVEQYANGKFRVTYGLQVKDNLNYAEAAKEYGEDVFHALACNEDLDNSQI